LEAFLKACPDVHVSVEEGSEFAIIVLIGIDLHITCVRHCPDPSHSCIMISIGTKIVPYKDEEKTVDYIDRVVTLIKMQLNLREMFKVFRGLYTVRTMHVVMKNETIQIMDGDFTPGSRTAIIQGGSLIHCAIEFRKDGQQNPALMAQFLKMIETASSAETVYAKFVGTRNGFFGFQEHQGKKFVSLSNYQGVSTTLSANGFRLFDIENFCKNPTNDLVVIHTTGTPFAGMIGLLEFVCANYAIIKVGNEKYNVPPEQWAFLINIIKMF
jgi:hypothetical protein